MNSKPKILLVDDEEAVRLAAKYSLDAWFNIITAETTVKALELIRNEAFDLILLDVMIREEGPESGIDALRIINKEHPEIPVVMLTGTISWMQKRDQLEQLGAKGYVEKPFDRNTIKKTIEHCLSNKDKNNG